MADTATPLTRTVTTPINKDASYYRDTAWEEQHENPIHVLPEFAVTEEGTTRTGQQLYDDIRITSNGMPHAHVTLVKDVNRLVLLHRANCHATPLGTPQELWNNKVLMFTGEVMENQLPQQCSSHLCY
jgi:hypothetical protein